MFGLMPCNQCSSYSEYVSKWRKRMQEALSLASKTEQRNIMTIGCMVWNYCQDVECW